MVTECAHPPDQSCFICEPAPEPASMTLRERAIAAYQASEAAYAANVEERHREEAARRREHLALDLKQALGIEGVEIIPAPPAEEGDVYARMPTAVVDGLTFTLVSTVHGDRDLGVYVPCPRCSDELVERLPWPGGDAEIGLGRILASPEGHRGLCPKDLDKEGNPKNAAPAVPPAPEPTTAERLVEALRALIYEEMEERGV
jgi:hypothetical protein